MKNILFIVAIFFWLHTWAQPQQAANDGVLSGKVIDADLKTPVSYANLVLYRTKDSSMISGVISDDKGFFTINQLPFGKFYIVANFIGYNKYVQGDILITPQQRSITLPDVLLQQAVKELDAVEVSAQKSAVEFQIDKKVINVSQQLSAAGGTAVDVLQNAPSVSTDVEGNVQLRGSSNFTVLIDGKPSVLQGSDALQQIPASSIQSIEIITNPSAKYDPEGTSGIINIVMKKQFKSGISGLINLTGGWRNKYAADATIQYTSDKYTIFFSGDYNNRPMYIDAFTDQKIYSDTNILRLYTGERSMNRGGYSAKAGIDYYVTKMSTLSLSVDIGQFAFTRAGKMNLHEWTTPQTYDYYSISADTFRVRRNYYKGNVQWKQKFDDKGHELLLMANYSGGGGSRKLNSVENETDANGTMLDKDAPLIQTIDMMNGFDARLQADYIKPINNGKVEAGAQSRIEKNNNDFIYNTFDYIANDWKKNTDWSNLFVFTQSIHSLYTTFSNKLFGFDYQLGLRGEYNLRNIEQQTTGKSYPFNRFDYFPTIHISRKLPLEQQLQVSYSRRINRPNNWRLNPVPIPFDSRNTRAGNPAILPELIDAYELNYQKVFKKVTFSLGGYYRVTNDKIEEVSRISDNGVMQMLADNVSKSTALGTELMVNIEAIKFMRINLTSNLYNYNVSGTIDSESIDRSSMNWDVRANIGTGLPFGTRIQLSGMYMSPSASAQGTTRAMSSFDVSVKQDFWKGKFSTTLQVRDIFGGGIRESTTITKQQYMLSRFQNEHPIVMLTLSYKINNFKQQQRQRQEGQDFGE